MRTVFSIHKNIQYTVLSLKKPVFKVSAKKSELTGQTKSRIVCDIIWFLKGTDRLCKVV